MGVVVAGCGQHIQYFDSGPPMLQHRTLAAYPKSILPGVRCFRWHVGLPPLPDTVDTAEGGLLWRGNTAHLPVRPFSLRLVPACTWVVALAEGKALAV